MHIQTRPAIVSKENMPAADTFKERRLRKACNDFEAIMVRQLIKTMRESVPKSGLFNDGFAKDIYQSISDSNLADSLTHNGRGLGIGEILYEKVSHRVSNSEGNHSSRGDYLP